MARMVTGSVAESVDPNIRHSNKERDGAIAAGAARVNRYVKTLPRRYRLDCRFQWMIYVIIYPMPTADMKVPMKAKVRMEPKFLKNWSCGR